MQACTLVMAVFRALMRPRSQRPDGQSFMPDYSQLSTMCGSQKFAARVDSEQATHPGQPLHNCTIINKLIRSFYGYCLILLVFSLLSMATILCLPFANDYLRSNIARKFDAQIGALVVETVAFFVAYKLITSIAYVVSNFYFMILGVHVSCQLVMQVIRGSRDGALAAETVTYIEDDCERLQNLPYSSVNALIKILEFIVFSSLLISRLSCYHAPVAAAYWLFLVISICLAVYTSRLNLKIMQSKQKRINFDRPRPEIQAQRRKEITAIKHLMFVDGVGLILPWVLNVGLLILIYGIVGLEGEQKYFILTVFGLLRTSISGLGANLNILAQAWSSLHRICQHLNQDSTPNGLSGSSSLISQYSEQIVMSESPASTPANTSTTLWQIADRFSHIKPCLKPCLALLIALSFASNLLYGFCSKEIISGQPVLTPFNLSILALQLVVPICLFWYICACNICISESIYATILGGEYPLQAFTSQEINRLSGDIRLLDRQLYFTSYGTISHLTSIFASFIYSSISLHDALLIAGFLCLFLLLTCALVRLFGVFVRLRRGCYTLEAVSKGQLLQQMQARQQVTATWQRIFTYKCFGYAVEIAFISLLYLAMAVLSFVVMVAVFWSPASVEASAVLVMLISQLDSQYIILFVQAVVLQISLTAVGRCFGVLDKTTN